MPAGISKDSTQPIALESTRFSTAEASPSYLFCIIVHATMKRARRQVLRCTRAKMQSAANARGAVAAENESMNGGPPHLQRSF